MHQTMNKIQVDWIRPNNDWFDLVTLDLGHTYFNNIEGVYIIWKANGPVVRVGQGILKNRLDEHRNNKDILAHGHLKVTWAPIASIYRNGIERYLANVLQPQVGLAFPNVLPTPVNLPWHWTM
jgi:hypothetical protein